MGQAIVYCSNCSAQIRGADFEARRAFKVDDLVYCKKCCLEILGAEPAAPLSTSSTKLKPSSASSSPPASSGRIGIVPHSTPSVSRPSRGPLPAILAFVGIGALVILVVVAASGGPARREPPPPPPSLNPPTVSTPPPAPRVSAKEAAAREALDKAIRFAADRSQAPAAQRKLLAEAVARAAGTSLADEARRELDLLDRKLRELRASEFARLEKDAAKGKADEALALWRKARGRFDDPSWAESVDRKIRELETVARTPPPTPAPPTPAPPPPAPDRSREDAARRAQWEAALSPSTGRDYAAALAALEKSGEAAPDLPLLRSVASLHREALQALARTPKGQKVAIEYRDAAGAPRRAEAAFIVEESGRVELRGDSGIVDIEAGEILPSSLADLLRSRGSAVDPAAAAVFCLLEGDEPGARRLAGDKAATVPERFWAYARNVAASRDPARALYQEALALANDFATAADAVPKFQALLRDHPESPFVRRNQASLAGRAQRCAREFLFLAADLKPSGAFKAAKSAKGNACWTSVADSDPAKLKDNFLELSYSVLADTPYKCWIYAGGCCQETFEFAVQGTEMKSGKEREPVEPGSGAAATIRPWLSSLKKTHAAHLGPKQPSHWEWVAIPLPKYQKPGLQQMRVLTDQKGFSVAFACVTATRTGAPREIELRELEKTRGDPAVPAAAQGPRAIVLFACALDGTDRGLVGDLRDRALHGITLFGSCFTGVEGNPVFTMPAQGELRITYFLKTATPLTARLRISRAGERSEPYDVAVPQPVAGRPTELRIPFSEFKPTAGRTPPPLVAGEGVPMVYFFGEDVNCGLRVDALSIVELRTEASGKPVFSENFDGGPGRFQGGEAAEGGVKGTKALSVPARGVHSFGAWSVVVKDPVTISFKLKPLGEVGRVDVMAWSEGLKDNGRYFVDGLKPGEWTEVRFKAAELRMGYARDGPGLDILTNIKIFMQGSAPESRLLLDDFEIRE